MTSGASSQEALRRRNAATAGPAMARTRAMVQGTWSWAGVASAYAPAAVAVASDNSTAVMATHRRISNPFLTQKALAKCPATGPARLDGLQLKFRDAGYLRVLSTSGSSTQGRVVG